MTNSQPRLAKLQNAAASVATEFVADLAQDAIRRGWPTMIDDDTMDQLGLSLEQLEALTASMGCDLGGPFLGSERGGVYYLIEEALILPEWPYGLVVAVPAGEMPSAVAEFASWLDAHGTGFRITEHAAIGAIHIQTTDFALAVAFIDEHGGMMLTTDETRRLFNGDCDSLPQYIVSESQRRTACATSTAT